MPNPVLNALYMSTVLRSSCLLFSCYISDTEHSSPLHGIAIDFKVGRERERESCKGLHLVDPWKFVKQCATIIELAPIMSCTSIQVPPILGHKIL